MLRVPSQKHEHEHDDDEQADEQDAVQLERRAREEDRAPGRTRRSTDPRIRRRSRQP